MPNEKVNSDPALKVCIFVGTKKALSVVTRLENKYFILKHTNSNILKGVYVTGDLTSNVAASGL